MQELVKKYIEGLEQAYFANEGEKQWKNFVSVKKGASDESILRLKELYPDIPESLIELLNFADGTYHRQYGDAHICLYFLGSDLQEYPYYLLSAEEMIANEAEAQNYSDIINREYEPDEIPVDDKIIDDASQLKWLHFSDCMNNGGTSQLFIDFSPSETGTSGQIVMYVHDPDSLEVIADSFDKYLEKLIDRKFDFINDDFQL